jgi:hypothetical protein
MFVLIDGVDNSNWTDIRQHGKKLSIYGSQEGILDSFGHALLHKIGKKGLYEGILTWIDFHWSNQRNGRDNKKCIRPFGIHTKCLHASTISQPANT